MEYNELTKRLLAEGYTVDHYPDYVQVDTSRLPGNNPLNNLSGGFEYKRFYRDGIVYKTGCGKFIMGSHVIDNFGYIIDWSHENDNPVFRCPYDKPECEYNDPRLHGMQGGGTCIQCWCTCHSTDDPYNYENSIEKADKEREEEKKRKYEEYSGAHIIAVEFVRTTCFMMSEPERGRNIMIRFDVPTCAIRMVTARF
jgi:hypothetical protein